MVHHRILSKLESISTFKQKNVCYIMPKERGHWFFPDQNVVNTDTVLHTTSREIEICSSVQLLFIYFWQLHRLIIITLMNTFEHMQVTLIYEKRMVESPKCICHIIAPATFTLTEHRIAQGLTNFPSIMTKICIPFLPVSKTCSIQLI